VAYYSNDNIIYQTNYQEHAFSVDYALMEHTYLGLTTYMFRRLDPELVLNAFPNDWSFRTRLNLYVVF